MQDVINDFKDENIENSEISDIAEESEKNREPDFTIRLKGNLIKLGLIIIQFI